MALRSCVLALRDAWTRKKNRTAVGKKVEGAGKELSGDEEHLRPFGRAFLILYGMCVCVCVFVCCVLCVRTCREVEIAVGCKRWVRVVGRSRGAAHLVFLLYTCI